MHFFCAFMKRVRHRQYINFDHFFLRITILSTTSKKDVLFYLANRLTNISFAIVRLVSNEKDLSDR